MAKMVEVSIYETNSKYSKKYGYYEKAKDYFKENDIPYSDRLAFKSTGERVVETNLSIKEVKKMAKATGMEYRVIF